MRSALLIFIKNPVLGKVKTRLAKNIGDQNALKIYQHLLTKTIEVTYELTVCDKYVFYNEFIPTKDDWSDNEYQKELQKGENLGEKMKNAFKQAFDDGYKRVVLIMPDCPKLTDNMIESSYKALNTYDCVIGPTNDGGFYLIGMKEFNPNVFEGKEYSTEQVFNEAVEEFTNTGKSWFKLPVLTDVDYEEDLGDLRKIIGLKVAEDEPDLGE